MTQLVSVVCKGPLCFASVLSEVCISESENGWERSVFKLDHVQLLIFGGMLTDKCDNIESHFLFDMK